MANPTSLPPPPKTDSDPTTSANPSTPSSTKRWETVPLPGSRSGATWPSDGPCTSWDSHPPERSTTRESPSTDASPITSAPTRPCSTPRFLSKSHCPPPPPSCSLPSWPTSCFHRSSDPCPSSSGTSTRTSSPTPGWSCTRGCSTTIPLSPTTVTANGPGSGVLFPQSIGRTESSTFSTTASVRPTSPTTYSTRCPTTTPSRRHMPFVPFWNPRDSTTTTPPRGTLPCGVSPRLATTSKKKPASSTTSPWRTFL
mmetsp:Transcript_20257/g.42096  ORF Transcript_20257/g.42096 Transcript_20257/m.42096 type:complete len:254 (-) Transcript_20257:179-940(-)